LIIKKVLINNINESLQLVKKVGCSKTVLYTLARKGIYNTIVINQMNNRGLNILKQEAISVGADVAVNENVSKFKCGLSNALLFANGSQMTKLISKLLLQPFGLHDFALKLKKILNNNVVFKCKNRYFNLKYPIVMGIINNLFDPNEVLKSAIRFEKLGASILSIVMRLSSLYYDSKTEIKRLLPILRVIKKHIHIPLAIDTYKYETAQVAINEGADIIYIYDISALNKEQNKLAMLISQQKTSIILACIKGLRKLNRKKQDCYDISIVYDFLSKQKQCAINYGIEKNYIAIDLGFNFSTNLEQTVKLIKNISVFSTLGAVIGTVSNKSIFTTFFKDYKTSYIIENLLMLLYGCNVIKVNNIQTTVNIVKFLKLLHKI
jgi:dihydropteroate synthase